MEMIGAAALPMVVGLILIYGFVKGEEVFTLFVIGAKDGMKASAAVLPTLIGLIIAVSMLKASGLLDMICGLVMPISEISGVSPELAPLALLRPVSGSGSSAYTLSILKQFGPDSETGKIASVLAASTETTFYAVAVYFSGRAYKRLYYTIPCALMGDIVAVIFSVVSVKVMG